MTEKAADTMRFFQRLPGIFAIGLVALVVLLTGSAHATFEFPDELETDPDPPTIADGESISIRWQVSSSDSSFSNGSYRIEVDGTGESGSGTLIESGSVDVDVEIETVVRADELGEEDDAYKVYIIVVNNDDSSDTDFTFQSVTLDNPPEPPTDIIVDWGDQKLEVSWTRSEDNDVDYYVLYYGAEPGDYDGSSSPVNVGDVESYTLTGLENGVTYYLALETVDTHNSESGYSEEVSGVPQETLSMGDLSDEEGGCFIATAAFGTRDAPAVETLRSFRDHVLEKSRAGEAVVCAYYRLSPPLARVLRKSPLLRRVVRILLGPVASGTGHLNPEGGN